MAYANRYFISFTGPDGLTHRFDLQEDGFLGSQTQIEAAMPDVAGCWERYGDPSWEPFDPLMPAEFSVGFVPIDRSTGLFSQSVLDGLRSIMTASPRQWRLIHTKAGVAQWRGYVMPRYTTASMRDGTQVVNVVAKDRVLSMTDVDYLDGTGAFYTGIEAWRVIITDILNKVGFAAVTTESQAVWEPAAETGDPLDTKVNRYRFSEGGKRDGTGRKAHRIDTVLRTALSAFGLVLVQHAGKWRLAYPAGHVSGASVTTHDYNTSGVKTGTASVSTPISIPAGVAALADAFTISALEPTRRADATYAYGPIDAGGLVNPRFNQWEPTNTDQAVGWTYTSAAGGFFQRKGDLTRYYLGVKESALVAQGSSDDTFAEACVEFASQDVGIFTGGSAGVDIEILYRMQGLQPQLNLTRLFYRLKYTQGASVYYYNKATGWSTGHSEAAKRMRFDGVLDNDETTPTFRLFADPITEKHTTLAFPGTGAGTLRIELGQPVREAVGGVGIGTGDVFALYAEVLVSLQDDTGQAGIRYSVVDPAVLEGLQDEVTLLVGDGPVASAPGALYLSDGTTLAGDWIRAPAATQMPHTQLVATERMRGARKPRRRLTLEAAVYGGDAQELASLTPYQAVEYGGVRYWPVSLEIERLTGRVRLVAVELRDDGDGSLDTDTETDDRGGVFAFGNPDTTFSFISDGVDALLADRAVTITTANIAAGAQTSVEINPVNAETFKDNAGFAIVDQVTHEVYNLVVNGDYAGGTTLNFDSNNFAHPVKAGSFVFDDPVEAYTRLILSEAGFSVFVEARELGTVNETIAPGASRGPSAGALVIDGLNYDVFDNQALRIVNDGPGGDGTVYGTQAGTIFLAGDQSATDTTLDIDNGAGGNVTFANGLVVGSTIQYADDKDRVPTALNVFFNAIEVQAKVFKSSDWDGVFNASTGVITTPGTKGWAFTGVAGQSADADITGSIHAGGGKITLDKDDGIIIEGSQSPTIGHKITWDNDPSADVEIYGYFAAPTGGDLRVLTDIVTIDATSHGTGTIQGIVFAGGSGERTIQATGERIKTVGSALQVPTGTTGARPGTPANGDFRYNTTTARFEGYENNAWFNVSGGGVSFPLTPADNEKIIFGTGSDFEQYFNGTAMIFDMVAQSEVHFMHGAEQMIVIEPDGSVILSHNGAVKFSTESGGVTVTGNAEADKFAATANGSASAPVVTRSTDTTTGMYFPSASTVRLTVGGTDVFEVNALSTIFPGNRTINVGSSNELELTHDGVGSLNTIRSNTYDLRFRLDTVEVMRFDQTDNGVEIVNDLNVGGNLTAVTNIVASGNVTLNGELDLGASGYIEYQELGFTPGSPVSSAAVRAYMRNDKLIWLFNDAGTTRYFFIDLTKTNQQQVQTQTTPP